MPLTSRLFLPLLPAPDHVAPNPKPQTVNPKPQTAYADRVAELLVRTGFEAPEALMLLVPEAYRNHPDLMKTYPEVVDFYEFYEGLQEGWDGPALLVFSDGRKVGWSVRSVG